MLCFMGLKMGGDLCMFKHVKRANTDDGGDYIRFCLEDSGQKGEWEMNKSLLKSCGTRSPFKFQ